MEEPGNLHEPSSFSSLACHRCRVSDPPALAGLFRVNGPSAGSKVTAGGSQKVSQGLRSDLNLDTRASEHLPCSVTAPPPTGCMAHT